MREIKFRAWDKEKKMMWAPTLIEINKSSGALYSHPDRNYIPYYPEQSILMQYTGLKDKNGKEIYEGDIVIVDGITHFIEWRGLGDWFIDIATDEAFVFTPELYDLEIIGNRYENPELLGI